MSDTRESLLALVRMSETGTRMEYVNREGSVTEVRRFESYVLRTARILGIRVDVDLVDGGAVLSVKSEKLIASIRDRIMTMKTHDVIRIPLREMPDIYSARRIIRYMAKKVGMQIKTSIRGDYLLVRRTGGRVSRAG